MGRAAKGLTTLKRNQIGLTLMIVRLYDCTPRPTEVTFIKHSVLFSFYFLTLSFDKMQRDLAHATPFSLTFSAFFYPDRIINLILTALVFLILEKNSKLFKIIIKGHTKSLKVLLGNIQFIRHYFYYIYS